MVSLKVGIFHQWPFGGLAAHSGKHNVYVPTIHFIAFVVHNMHKLPIVIVADLVQNFNERLLERVKIFGLCQSN